ncbi:MAG: hypothetical protein IT355_17270 [Gemmatimonadaceae bacterium]|nr:hypothetical protein [Gemmatimonadaceae bacterium]
MPTDPDSALSAQPGRTATLLPDADHLLALPAAQAARLVLRAAVTAADEAVTAVTAAEAPDDAPTSLHAALDRLRVLLDAWEPVLRDTVPATVRPRVSAFARLVGTDAARHALRTMLEALQPADADPATATLVPPPAHGDAQGTRVIRERWARIHGPLLKGIATWHERHRIDARRAETPFATLAAEALSRAIDRFERKWAALVSPDDLPALHAAHSAARSLVHTLEPLAAATPDGAIALAGVTSLAAHLDDVRTASALRLRLAGDRDHSAAPDDDPHALLQRHLVKRIAGHIRSLGAWTVPRHREHEIARLRGIAAAWRTAGTPAMEIERKWLLSALPPRAAEEVPVVLAQGYLEGTALVERIRCLTRGDDVQWRRTVKLGAGMARIEVEEPVSPALAGALYALTEGRRVTKRRHTVHDGTAAWEIDDFTDRALVLAELELPAVDAPFTIPGWLAPYIVREVTGESGFTNWQLAH